MFLDRIFEISTSSGSGNFILDGQKNKYHPFSLFKDDPFYYVIEDSDDAGHQWELGEGRMISPRTLERTTILDGSSGKHKVEFDSHKTWNVFNVVPADYLKQVLSLRIGVHEKDHLTDIIHEAGVSKGDFLITRLDKRTYINKTGGNISTRDWIMLPEPTPRVLTVFDELELIMPKLPKVAAGDFATLTSTGETYLNHTGQNRSIALDWFIIGSDSIIFDKNPPLHPVQGDQWFNINTGLLGTYLEAGLGQWVAN